MQRVCGMTQLDVQRAACQPSSLRAPGGAGLRPAQLWVTRTRLQGDCATVPLDSPKNQITSLHS